MGEMSDVEHLIADWCDTVGSEPANDQSFINDLWRLLGIATRRGSRPDDAQIDHVFERRVCRAPFATMLDFGEAAVAPVRNVIPWPATLPEQVGTVQSILAAANAQFGASDIARSFKGKRAATVRPMLEALASLKMARRLNDGRYAA